MIYRNNNPLSYIQRNNAEDFLLFLFIKNFDKDSFLGKENKVQILFAFIKKLLLPFVVC